MNLRDSYAKVTWDLASKNFDLRPWGKVGDTGRGIVVTVAQNGVVKTPTTETLRMSFIKPDGTEGYIEASLEGGKYYIENLSQVFSVVGIVNADLEFQSGTEFIRSMTFLITVHKPMQAVTIISSNDYSALQEALQNVEELKLAMNKTAVTFSHQFADNTARDAYFASKPLELIEKLFIKVGTGYQQRVNGSWQAANPILTVIPATSGMAIADAGNKYTSTNVEDALQEIAAKADTKVDKVAGKQLSTEDYTTADKAKMANVPVDVSASLADIVDKRYDYKGLLDNTKNLDDVMKSGIYFIPNTSPVNTPTDLSGKAYILRVDFFNEAYALQVAYDYYNPSTFFSRRVYTWANPKGTDWTKGAGGGYQKIIGNTYNLNVDKLSNGYYWILAGNQPINTPSALVGKSYIINQELFHEDAYAIQSAFNINEPHIIYRRYVYYYALEFTPWKIIGDNPNVKPLTGKKLLTLGDSITYGAMSTNHYQDKIAEITGATIINAGYSGSKYALILNHTPWNEFSFYQRSIDYDLTDIEYIFVMYGTNDFGNHVPIGTMESDEYTIKGALVKGLTNLFTRKPDLKIFFSTPIFRATYDGTDFVDLDTKTNDLGLTIHDYSQAALDVCEKFRIPVFNAQAECGINQQNHATYLADRLHPNNDGNDLIGIQFANFIKKYV